MAPQRPEAKLPAPPSRKRTPARPLVPLGVLLLVLAGALTGVRAGEPEIVDVDSYRHVPTLRYQSARIVRGRHSASIHLVDAEERRYRLPLGRRTEAYAAADLVRRFAADSVAEVWLKEGDGYPVIRGIRAPALTLDPADAVPLDQRRRVVLSLAIPITLVAGVLVLLVGARRLRATPAPDRIRST